MSKDRKRFAMNWLVMTFVVLAIAIVGVAAVVIGKDPSMYGVKKRDLVPSYEIDRTVVVEFEDGSEMETKIPFRIHSDQPFYVKLDLSGVGMVEGKTLSFVAKDMPLRCEVDGEVIFRQSPCGCDSHFYDANALYFIHLPDDMQKEEVILRFENYTHYESVFSIDKMRVGNRIALVVDYAKEDIFGLVVAIFVSFTFVAYLLSTNFMRNVTDLECYFAYNIVLSLLVGMYIVCNLTSSYFLFHRYNLYIDMVQYTSIMFTPMCLLMSMYYRLDLKENSYLSLAIVLASCNILVQYGLTILHLSNFALMVRYSYLVVLVSDVIALYAMFTTEKTHARIGLTKASIVVFIGSQVLQLFEMYVLHKQGVSSLFLIAVMIYAMLCFIEIFSYYGDYRDEKMKSVLYQKLALEDQLTGVGNRFAYSKQIEALEENRRSCYVVLMDIDGLKYVNDTYGHTYGDKIIQLLGSMLTNFNDAHPKDVYRLGGDEFVMLYYGDKFEEFESELKELVSTYEQASVDSVNEFGVSYGYSYFDAEMCRTMERCLHLADQRMYEFKQKKHIERGKWTKEKTA